MTAVLLLLGYALSVGLAAPALLRRSQWLVAAPRLGIALWSASVASVALALLLVPGVLVALPQRSWDTACGIWRFCLTALRGEHGPAGRVLAVVGLAVAGLLLARVAYAAYRAIPGAIRWRRHHIAGLRLVGRGGPSPDVTVVDHPIPAAYLVAARPAPLVVVTSAAVESVTDAELAAVIAHERAHAAGRHHLLVAALGLLRDAFPASRLLSQAYASVCRLVEVCADSSATRHHDPLDLARALVTIAEGTAEDTPNRPSGPVVVAALGAAGGDAATRIHRLINPPPQPRRHVAIPLYLATAALPLAPLALAALTPWWPTLMACPRLFG